MKKIILCMTMLFFAAPGFAQDINAKAKAKEEMNLQLMKAAAAKQKADAAAVVAAANTKKFESASDKVNADYEAKKNAGSRGKVIPK